MSPAILLKSGCLQARSLMARQSRTSIRHMTGAYGYYGGHPGWRMVSFAGVLTSSGLGSYAWWQNRRIFYLSLALDNEGLEKVDSDFRLHYYNAKHIEALDRELDPVPEEYITALMTLPPLQTLFKRILDATEEQRAQAKQIRIEQIKAAARKDMPDLADQIDQMFEEELKELRNTECKRSN